MREWSTGIGGRSLPLVSQGGKPLGDQGLIKVRSLRCGVREAFDRPDRTAPPSSRIPQIMTEGCWEALALIRTLSGQSPICNIMSLS